MEHFGAAGLRALIDAHRAALLETHAQFGDATAVVRAEAVVPLMAFLRDQDSTRFDMLIDLTGVDHIGSRPRFEVVYHLYSTTHEHRLRIKTFVEEDACEIDSVVSLWPVANWLEREAYDMYGIRFRGHPDLRRLLLYEEFEGHPLRKDYPKERRQPLIGPRN